MAAFSLRNSRSLGEPIEFIILLCSFEFTRPLWSFYVWQEKKHLITFLIGPKASASADLSAVEYTQTDRVTLKKMGLANYGYPEFFREPCLLRPFWFVPAKWPHINWERFWNTITANDRNLVMLCKYSKHDSSYTIISFCFSKRLCWCSPWLHYKIPTWTYLGDFPAYSRTYWIHWKNNLQTNLTKEPSC